MDSIQDEWLTCQRSWIHLESVFSAPDIQRQLPNEARMFAQVDKSWREIMSKTNRVRFSNYEVESFVQFARPTFHFHSRKCHSLHILIHFTESIGTESSYPTWLIGDAQAEQ
jgi:hypothetical protein